MKPFDRRSLEDPPTPTISMKSKVSLNLIIALFPGLVIAIVMWFKIDNMEKKIDTAMERQWTKSHQALFAEQLRGQNPTVKVPQVSDVVNAIGKTE